ncbi:MAG TPA: hypothetical protein VF770_05510, partial [Solirubrobacterales bacterium]
MLQPHASGDEASIAERAIFVADRPWRQWAVSAAVALAGALLLAWLAVIVAGALGFGSLPTLPFVSGGNHAAATVGPRAGQGLRTHGAVRGATAAAARAWSRSARAWSRSARARGS